MDTASSASRPTTSGTRGDAPPVARAGCVPGDASGASGSGPGACRHRRGGARPGRSRSPGIELDVGVNASAGGAWNWWTGVPSTAADMNSLPDAGGVGAAGDADRGAGRLHRDGSLVEPHPHGRRQIRRVAHEPGVVVVLGRARLARRRTTEGGGPAGAALRRPAGGWRSRCRPRRHRWPGAPRARGGTAPCRRRG